jgi:hypothetical protein
LLGRLRGILCHHLPVMITLIANPTSAIGMKTPSMTPRMFSKNCVAAAGFIAADKINKPARVIRNLCGVPKKNLR